MVVAKSVLAALLIVGIAYTAYPYVTLYRLGHALQTGDAATLRALVNWSTVREGIKEDLCDDVSAGPAQTVSDNQLPAFGASFVRGIASNVIDRRVTPQNVAAMTRRDIAATDTGNPLMHVTWAFFRDPTDFAVSVKAPGQPGPIRLEMTLDHAAWQVTRIWLPHTLLRATNAGT